MGALLIKKNTSKGNTVKGVKAIKTTSKKASLKGAFTILTKEEVENDRSSAYAYVVTA